MSEDRSELVGRGGFEPPTSRLSSARSNQLSYQPGRQRTEDRCQRTERSSSLTSDICLLSSESEGMGGRPPGWAFRRQGRAPGVLRKEVIQPQVPLRLPCYDFTPVADLTVVGCLQRLAHRLRVKPTPMV